MSTRYGKPKKKELVDEMFLAVERGELDYVQRLVEGYEWLLDYPIESGWTPLMFACRFGNLKIVTFLIEQGAQTQGDHGYQPLHAACFGGSADVVSYLLFTKGLNVNVDSIDKTPFTIAQQTSYHLLPTIVSAGAAYELTYKKADASAERVTLRMNDCEKKLHPKCVTRLDYEGFKPEQQEQAERIKVLSTEINWFLHKSIMTVFYKEKVAGLKMGPFRDVVKYI